MKTFEQAWAEKEAQGYQYGESALEGVRFGWQIRADVEQRHLADILDLLAAANVSPREAAAVLRAGRTLEDLCDPSNLPSKEPCGPGCTVGHESSAEHVKRRGDTRKEWLDRLGEEEQAMRQETNGQAFDEAAVAGAKDLLARHPDMGAASRVGLEAIVQDKGFGMDAGPYPHPRSDLVRRSCLAHEDCETADTAMYAVGYRGADHQK